MEIELVYTATGSVEGIGWGGGTPLRSLGQCSFRVRGRSATPAGKESN
jgi:hypothetical protein